MQVGREGGTEGGREGDLFASKRWHRSGQQLMDVPVVYHLRFAFLPPGIETLLNAFPSAGSGGGKAAARVRIPEGGVCPHCQGQLQPLRLDREERKELRER